MQCGIYKIVNNINGKVYIGQSVNIKSRWSEHKSHAFSPERHSYNYPIYRAIRKYGLKNFSFEIIELCDKTILNEREQFWIKYYNSIDRNYGYNLILSNQTANHSNIKVKQYDLQGNFIKEYNSIREAERETGIDSTLIGRCCNPNFKNLRAGEFQWCYSTENLDGKKYKGRKVEVAQYDEKGILLNIYPTMAAAAKEMKVTAQSIEAAIYKGYHCCGYIWKKV